MFSLGAEEIYQLKAIAIWLLVIYCGMKLYNKKHMDSGAYIAIGAVYGLILAVFNHIAFIQVVVFTGYTFGMFIITYKGGTFHPEMHGYEIDPAKRVNIGGSQTDIKAAVKKEFKKPKVFKVSPEDRDPSK